MFLFQDCLPVKYDLVTFYGYNFSGIFIHKIFYPGLEYPGGQLPSQILFQIGPGHLDLVCQAEYFQDVLVAFKSYGTQEGGDRQFLFPVNVSVHHVIDVCREFYPGTFEWDDTGRVQLGPVGVNALSEEHTGRTVQL